MALREKKSTKERYVTPIDRREKKKIFVIAEGDKTETKYFQGLKDNAKSLGIDNVIIVLEKDDKSKGTSDPDGLVKLVEDKKKSLTNPSHCDEVQTYDPNNDEFLIIMDRDKDFNQDKSKLRESEKRYHDFIEKYKDKYILGITNPCFEVWLLLHKENAVGEIIEPNYDKILYNKKISSNHTYISKLVSEYFHMNSKKGMRFSKFKDNVINAVKQEKLLPQDLVELEDKVGSNIGKIIEEKFIN